jgi:hypothetical protein
VTDFGLLGVCVAEQRDAPLLALVKPPS